ncbi:hypothetical protein ABZ814_17655 [Micromonospora musae]
MVVLGAGMGFLMQTSMIAVWLIWADLTAETTVGLTSALLSVAR